MIKKKLLLCNALGIIILFFVSFFLCNNYCYSSSLQEREKLLAKASGAERRDLLLELAKYYRYNEPLKTIAYAEEALEFLKKHPSKPKQVTALNLLGTGNVGISKYKEGRQYMEKALELAQAINHPRSIADTRVNLCFMEFNENNFEKSVKNGREAIEIYEKINDEVGLAHAYTNVGIAYWLFSDFSTALEYFLKGTAIYERRDIKEPLGDIYVNMGVVYSSINDYEHALLYLYKAKDIFDEFGNKMGLSVTLNNIANIFNIQKKYDDALKYLGQALEISLSLGTRDLESTIISTMGEIYESMGDYKKALEHLEKALAIDEEINNRQAISQVLLNTGRTKRKMGDLDEALSLLKRSLALAIEIKFAEETLHAHHELTEIYAAKKDFARALEHHKKYKELNDMVFTKESSRKIAEMQTRYKLERKKKEIALLKKDKEIKQLNLERHQSLQNSLITISGLILLTALLIYTRYRLKVSVNLQLSREINGHKITSEKLRESEEKFRVLAEKSMVGIAIVQDTVFKYVNPALAHFFEYSLEELHGKSPYITMAHEEQWRLREALEQQISGEYESMRQEYLGVTRSGQTINIVGYVSRILYQGHPAVLMTLIDISQRKKAEAELLKSQKMEAVGILAGGIAHDFNNLLAILVGNLSMIKTHLDDFPECRETLVVIEKSTSRATDLANKLITFSKGGWLMARQLHLQDILDDTAKYHPTIAPLMKNRSIAPDLKPIHGDKRQLREVIYNLLKNADDALKNATVEDRRVEIQADNIFLDDSNQWSLIPGEYIKVSIRDNGRGIPIEKLGNIFDPYFSTKNTVIQKGIGLGLAICYSVLQRHKGHITVNSEIGKGTVVDLYLPTYKENDPKEKILKYSFSQLPNVTDS
jgi:PAS domain S-box-containing protein